MSKEYTITIYDKRRDTERDVSGTLKELIDYFDYDLMIGQEYQMERGNRKINRKPRTIDELVDNLNNAARNAASNGNPSRSYDSY